MMHLLVFIVILGTDLLLKLWAKKFLYAVGSVNVIPNVLNWTWVENRGVAFGFLTGHKTLILIINVIVVGIIIYLVYKKIFSTFYENLCLISISAGGLANGIDRFINGYVIDYIDISPLFNYPVFNFADCCIVIGVIVLVLLTFLKKDEEDSNS